MKLIKYYKHNCRPCAELALVLAKELPKYEAVLVEERFIADFYEEAAEMGVMTVPTTFLVDDTGNIIASQRGVLGVAKMLEKHLVPAVQ